MGSNNAMAETSDVRERCLAIYRRHLDHPALTGEAEVSNVCDSTKAVLIAMALEACFEIEVSMRAFYTHTSVDAMSQHIESLFLTQR
jgi:acyl carrier protein